MPIATLPMFWGKMYAVYETAMMQRVVKLSTASFDPVLKEGKKALFGLTDEGMPSSTAELSCVKIRAPASLSTYIAHSGPNPG